MRSPSLTDLNAIRALTHLLRLAQVRVTALTVQERLEEHPDFPSLSAIADILNEFNVANLATKLTADRLLEIPLPALVQVRVGEDEQFAPVRTLNAETVEWLDTAKGWQQESLADFLNRWTGIALLIEPTEACRLVHKQLEAVLERIPDLRVEMVPVASTNPDDRAGKVAQHLLGLQPNRVDEAMRRWFNNPQQSITCWLRKVGAEPVSEQTQQQLAMNNYWHSKSGLQFTPIVYYNSMLLPPFYRVSDLPHLYKMWPAEPLAQPKMDSVESI